MTTSNGSREIRWSAPEFPHYEKDANWYWIVLVAAVLIIGIALFQKNFLFAIFILIATALMLNWGQRAPRTMEFVLSGEGFSIEGEKQYRFEDLLGFAIIPTHDDSELDELVFQTKGRLNGWLKVSTITEQRDAIRQLLEQHLLEIEYEESMADHIGRIVRF